MRRTFATPDHHYTLARESAFAHRDKIITDTPIFDALFRAVESEYRDMNTYFQPQSRDFSRERRRISRASPRSAARWAGGLTRC